MLRNLHRGLFWSKDKVGVGKPTIFATRCKLYLVISEIPALQSRFDKDESSDAYVNAAYDLYDRLRDSWSTRSTCLEITSATPQLILLQ